MMALAFGFWNWNDTILTSILAMNMCTKEQNKTNEWEKRNGQRKPKREIQKQNEQRMREWSVFGVYDCVRGEWLSECVKNGNCGKHEFTLKGELQSRCRLSQSWLLIMKILYSSSCEFRHSRSPTNKNKWDFVVVGVISFVCFNHSFSSYSTNFPIVNCVYRVNEFRTQNILHVKHNGQITLWMPSIMWYCLYINYTYKCKHLKQFIVIYIV